MTAGEFHAYLLFVAVFAAALGALNLWRPQKRWLGAGALCLSVAAILYATSLSLPRAAFPAALAVVCLGMDVSVRGRRKA